MAPLLRELKRLIRLRVAHVRDTVGFDIAALRLIARIAKERKDAFLPVDTSTKDVWAGLGLGSDVAAALEGRHAKR